MERHTQGFPGGIAGIVLCGCYCIFASPWLAGKALIRDIRWNRKNKRRQKVWDGYKEERNPPASVWSDRRPLTPSLPAGEETPRARTIQAQPQSQSSLLRFPAEIREMVWMNVMTSPDPIVISRAGKRLYGVECTAGGEFDRRDSKNTLPYRFTGLLASCRQVYCETIDILYQKNTFHFRDAYAFNLLPRVVVPAKLSSITSLTISINVCEYDSTEAYWQDLNIWVWAGDVLEKMTGLQRLHASFSESLTCTNMRYGSDHLPPLLDVEGIPDFVVTLYDDPHYTEEEWRNSLYCDVPFRLVLRPRPGSDGL
ncbi:uncharacterized protein APUU_60132S [Aspergillus puulaauensis]|uniref:DUF7730 domain-containing protein n=1 Tax=Aspergillus puulaauensis TaxID=1220207 RepID=A0A7R8APF7_9EURO|nr:uncharacterized protein APUU_60132S [Aspergillus puulaauensis]BCS27084.1 hypothetical protein APUU_60132S [Aspergillus puulaauensis]